MDGKTLIVGIAALILGGLGGYLLGGSQSSEAVTQEQLQMMVTDPQTREMMVEEVMSNEDAKQMVTDKMMMEREDETVMEDTEPDDEMMDAETEDKSMMKDEDSRTKEDSMMEQ